MGAVVVLAVLAAAGAALVAFRWRPGRDEGHSVRDYQHTLDTLRHVSERPDGPTPASGRRRRAAAAGVTRARSRGAAPVRIRTDVSDVPEELPASRATPGEEGSRPGSAADEGGGPDEVTTIARFGGRTRSTSRRRPPQADGAAVAGAEPEARRRGSGARLSALRAAASAASAATGEVPSANRVIGRHRSVADGGSRRGDVEAGRGPGRGTDAHPDVVFDDLAPNWGPGQPGPAGASGEPPGHRPARASGVPGRSGAAALAPRFTVPNRSARAWPAVAAVAVVAVVGVVLAVTLSGGGSPRPRAIPSSPRSHSPTTAVPTTTPPVLQPTSSTAYDAVYTVPATSYTLQLTAAHDCWVDATDTTTGATLWEGILQAGATEPLKASGAVDVLLGASGVTMTVDGAPVTMPTGYQVPFRAHFEAS